MWVRQLISKNIMLICVFSDVCHICQVFNICHLLRFLFWVFTFVTAFIFGFWINFLREGPADCVLLEPRKPESARGARNMCSNFRPSGGHLGSDWYAMVRLQSSGWEPGRGSSWTNTALTVGSQFWGPLQAVPSLILPGSNLWSRHLPPSALSWSQNNTL